MILLYGAGGGPGRGEIPMDLLRKQASDVFPFACGVSRTNNMQRPKPKRKITFGFWWIYMIQIYKKGGKTHGKL